MADSHPPAEPTIQIPETLDPPIEKDEGPRPNVVAVPQTETVEENPHSEISQVEPTEPEHQDGQTEHLQAPLSMDLPEQSEVTVIEVSAAVLATELPTEVEENDGTEPVEAEYEPDELDDEEDLGEPVPPEDTQTSSNDLSNPAPHGLGDESAESSATLESSVHGEFSGISSLACLLSSNLQKKLKSNTTVKETWRTARATLKKQKSFTPSQDIIMQARTT